MKYFDRDNFDLAKAPTESLGWLNGERDLVFGTKTEWEFEIICDRRDLGV